MFGAGPCGAGPCGRFDWAATLVTAVPPRIRAQDNGDLVAFVHVVAGELDWYRRAEEDAWRLNDPLASWSEAQVTEDVSVNGMVVDAGRVKLSVAVNKQAVPKIEILSIVPGWRCTIAGSVFVVDAVDTVSSPSSVWLVGVMQPAFEPTVLVPIATRFEAPAVLDRLVNELGLPYDLHDPVWMRRSLALRSSWWWRLKSSGESYRIRGALSNFDVEARQLWRVTDTAVDEMLPSSRLIQSGDALYTDVKPVAICFDDIAADVFGAGDDDPYIYQDGTADGSNAMAFAQSIAQVVVLNVLMLTPAECLQYGVSYGWHVLLTFQAALYYERASDWSGGFWLRVPSGDYWLTMTTAWDLANLNGRFVVETTTQPVIGESGKITYDGRVVERCGWCASNRMQLRFKKKATNLESGKLLSDALIRVSDMLKVVVPAHVRLLPPVYAVEVVVGMTQTVGVTILASVGVDCILWGQYDQVGGDQIGVDPTPPEVTATY